MTEPHSAMDFFETLGYGVPREPVPLGWVCEDCEFGAFTDSEALDHSDEHGHSLAVCPLWMPVRRPETEPERA